MDYIFYFKYVITEQERICFGRPIMISISYLHTTGIYSVRRAGAVPRSFSRRSLRRDRTEVQSSATQIINDYMMNDVLCYVDRYDARRAAA